MFVRIWELVFPIWRFFRSQNISWRSAEIVRVAITIVLLQSPTAYFITKCDGLFMYYKVRQFYYKLHQVLQCATKCEEHSINGLLTYLSRTYILHTAISRKVFGKSVRDNTERYCRWSWVHCYLKKFERMALEATSLDSRQIRIVRAGRSVSPRGHVTSSISLSILLNWTTFGTRKKGTRTAKWSAKIRT